MNRNIKIAKQLIKIAKNLVASNDLEQVFDVDDLSNDVEHINKYYDYGDRTVALVTEIDDDWLPVLVNGRYESQPEIEEQVKEWMRNVKFIEFGGCEESPSTLNGTVCTIIIRKNSPLLK